MAAVMPRPERERLPSFSKQRVYAKSKLQVRSPKSVLLPESPGSSSTGSSSLSSSIINDQIVECTSFRNPVGTDSKSSGAGFEQVNNYTWFVSIDRPSDLVVEVDNVTFHLHKLPLLSRSGLLFRLASQSSDSGKTYINVVDMPGGADAFIVVAKFCYGIAEELTPTNVATIRCAAEYLEMTEAFEEENLISKSEAYLNLVYLNSWQESIIVLQSCELLLPLAQDMNLVKRCADSVAKKACTDPDEVHWLYSGIEKNSTMPTASQNASEAPAVRIAPKDWWYEDVSHLSIFCFSEVMVALDDKGMNPDLMGGALEYYAQMWLPGFITKAEAVSSKGAHDAASTRKNSPISSPLTDGDGSNCSHTVTAKYNPTKLLQESIIEQNRSRFILEEIVGMLPQQRDAVSCSFLLRATRAAHLLNCGSECKADLERRAGLQLDKGSLSDLLIPSFSHTSESLYDIDLVHRIVDQFLTQDRGAAGSPGSCKSEKRTQSVYDGPARESRGQPPLHLRTKVAKLLDAYLAEVARNTRVPLEKFQSLAEALPEGSRLCDDGLYRAIDTYLKIHSTLSEHERKRLCRILDCHRLSLDACTHASQNERLPLRFVVQVLFCEQLKIRRSVTEIKENGNGLISRESTPTARSIDTPAAVVLENLNQLEIRVLQKELASMRVRCSDLERDQTSIQDQVGELTDLVTRRSSSWSGAWKRLLRLHLFHNKDEVMSSSVESRPGTSRGWRNSIS